MDINERIAALQVGSCTDHVYTIERAVHTPMINDSKFFTVREMLDEQGDLEEAMLHAGRVTADEIVVMLQTIRDLNLRERRKLTNDVARDAYQPRRFTVEPTQRTTFHVGPRRAVTEITLRIRRVE
jgi:hypothetical protein